MSGFIDNRIEELPRWMAGRQGRAFAIAQGAQQDLELRLEIDGVKQRWPTSCCDEALDDVGRGFQIERYPGESHASYRARLLVAWQTWIEAGTPDAIEVQLRAWGIPDVRVYRDFDGVFAAGAWYSRFWIVIGPRMPWVPLLCGNFVCGDGSTCGSTATVEEINAVRRIILKWKSYYGYPVKVILKFFDGSGPREIPLCGVDNLTAPFTCGREDGEQVPYCTWAIGKTTHDTLGPAPFICGGFFDGTDGYFDR